MKVKSAEQYKALRKRELAKKQKRQRKGKSRLTDYFQGDFNGVLAESGMVAQYGYRSKPNHKARTLRITDVFSKLAIGCPQSRNLESHYAHPMVNGAGMCPGYLRVREDEQHA